MTRTTTRARSGPVSEALVQEPPVPSARQQRFEELFGANREAVLRYLVRRTANRHDAADLLADTFLVAWRRLEDVPPGDLTRPWLYGVARRVLANHLRGEDRRHALADRLRQELAGLDVARSALLGNSPAAVAFRALPEQDRELLSLVAWEELGTSQIAVVLGISHNAVRIRLHRARKRFAKLLTAPLANQAPATLREEASHEGA